MHWVNWSCLRPQTHHHWTTELWHNQQVQLCRPPSVWICWNDHKQFKDRLAEHKDYSKRDVFTEPSGEHFNKPGHGVHHLKSQSLFDLMSFRLLYFLESLMIKEYSYWKCKRSNYSGNALEIVENEDCILYYWVLSFSRGFV